MMTREGVAPRSGSPPEEYTRRLRDLLPLARGELREFRQTVQTRLVLSALRPLTPGTHLTAEQVRQGTVRAFDFTDFPLESVARELDRLCDLGLIDKVGVYYRVLSIPPASDFDRLATQLVSGFRAWLTTQGSEFDSIDLQGLKLAVERSMDAIVGAFVTEVVQATPGPAHPGHAELEESLGSIWRGGSPKLELAGHAFLDFLESENHTAEGFLATVYQTALAVDILVRGRDLEGVLSASSLTAERVYLDANCIAAVLNPTSRYHEVVISSVRLARRFHFPVGYTATTRLEMHELIAASGRWMRIGNPVEAAERNEFVLDFSKRLEHIRWPDRLAQLESWQTLVEDQCDIVLFPDDLVENEASAEFPPIFETLLATHREYREKIAVQRDEQLVSRVLSRRNHVGDSLLGTPVIETLDRFLAEADAIRANRRGTRPVVVRASLWLRLLSEFLSASFEDSDVRRVGRSLLRNLTVTGQPTLTIDEYSRLLAARFDLEPARSTTIAQMFVNSIYHSEMGEALDSMDADQVTKYTQQILTDTALIDEVVGADRARAEADRLRGQLSNVAQELRVTREVNRYLREALSRPPEIRVSFEGLPVGVMSLSERLVKDIQTRAAQHARDEGIDLAMLQVPDRGAFDAAARRIAAFLGRYGPTIASLQTLIPLGSELLAMLGLR